MSAKEKANLARIRDNQRRSRARRKEYLQELEARLRQCELQGIEASSEIQVAARRVADENKKLRGLLAQHGVSEDSIENHLQSSPTSDTMMGGPYGGTSAAVQALEQLLQTRKACCADGATPMTTSTNIAAGSRASSGSTSTVQTPWDPVFTQNPGGHRRSDILHSNGKAASSAPHFMTPSTSTASRTSSVSAQNNSHSISAHHHIAPLQMPRNPGHHQLPSRNQQMLEFIDNQISFATQGHSQSSENTQRRLQSTSSGQRSSVYIPTSQANMNSCGYATDMITTMAGVDPGLVRSDLGCMDPAMDCEVDNHIVFNVMDRYTGSVGL